MAVKKRTLGDDLRDFKAGKVPDGYRDNIKNTTPYVIKNWQHSDGFVGGEDAADNPIYGEVTTSSKYNKTKGINSFLYSGNQMVNSVQNDFRYNENREYENKYKNYNYEQLKTSYKSAKDDREKNWILNKIKKDSSSEELQNWYDNLSQEYDSKLQQNPDPKISKEFEEKASEYEDLIKDKQRQETVQKNQKKNELYEDYYKNYDYKQLKEESDNGRLSEYERSWLENAAYDKASSEDLQTSYDNNEKTMKEIREQKKSVLEKQNKASSNEEKQSYIRETSNLDEQYDTLYSKNETLKNQIEKKKYEEKKKAEYDDVIENNIKAKTIMQKYYNLQKYDEDLMKPAPVRTIQGFENNKGKSELDAYNYAENLSLEEREQIKNDFNSLENKDTLYKYYKREREEQETAEKNQILTDYSEEHPVLGSLASIGLNTYGSIEDTVKYAGAGIDKAFGGDGYINPDSTNVAKAQLMREKVSEDMDGIGKFFYNTGMSIGDNLARMPLLALPGGEAMSLALAGTSAGVSSANDVINSGGSLESALWTGAAAGTAEVVFEKIPLDNLIKLKKEGTESVFKAVLNQMKTEGLEELGTDITNAITDGIINGDMSQLALQYQNYIAQGYSEEEARKQISFDFASQLGQSFAAGAISGGVMSGGTVAINKIGETIGTKSEKRKSASQLGREALQSEDFNVNELINTAKKSDNPKAVNLANSLEKVVEEKGADKVKAVDVGNLLTLTNSDEITYDYSQDLSELTGTDKQNIINRNFELNGEEKTAKTSDSEVKYTDTKAFGENYPHGLGAKISKTGELINIVGIKCSAKDFNSDDNTVVLLADNGELYDADDITTSITYFNNLFDYAKNFDTIGARVYLSQYEDYVKRSKSIGNKADVAEYSKCFERLYSYGIKGVTYDSIKKSGNFTREINILSAGVAYSAVQSGNNDFKVDTRDKSNKLQKIRMPGESNSINSKVYVDPGSEESVKVTDEQLAILQTVADKTGREIVLTDRMGEITGDENANGGYNPNDGKIYINAEVHDSYMLSVSLHEAVHGVAADNPAEYHALCTFITNYLVAKGENIDNLLDDIKIKWGDSVRSEDAALEELVCQTVMAIATDEAAIKTALSLEENKGILKKVASALKKIAKAAYDFIKGVGIQAHNKQAQPWIDNIEALKELAVRLEKAFESTRTLNEQRASAAENTETEQKNNTHEGVKYSYGGLVAETADISLLDKAQKMENSGKDSEDIRKETGWFRGYDGKWRFEIDDSKMEIEKADKEYLKKYSSTLLGYLVKHNELFDAYPELKDIYIKVKDTNGEGDAYYSPGEKSITINSDSLNSLSNTELKKVLIHEIQHAIQDIEGFTPGTDTNDFFKYLNTAGEIEAYDTGDRMNMDSKQRKNTRPDIDRKDVVFAENGVSYFAKIKKSSKEDQSTIKEQIKTHLTKLNTMEPVANINSKGRDNRNDSKIKEDVLAEYKKIGNGVDRQDFGFIELSKKEVSIALSYLKSDAEIATFAAVPKVLKRGIEIDHHKSHKDRGYDSWTFAAPVTINGKKGFVGAVVRKTGQYRYKTHRIVATDGTEFVLIKENAEARNLGVTTEMNDSKGSNITSAFNETIPQNNKNVKHSVDDVIDENRDLVAVHNLSAKKLAKMISDFDGQGIPAPSIAIDKADNVHSDFGEISLIFDRNTIDPKADRRNSVYSRDAWTSMYPKTEFKLNEKAMKKLAERLDMSVNELKSNMFDTSDIQKIKYRFEDDIKVRKAFLKENNIKATPVLRDRQPDIMMFSARAVKKFVRKNDCTFDRLVNDKEFRNGLFKAYSDGASLKGIANAHIKETDEILDLAKSEEFYSVLKEKFDYAIEYAKGNVQQTEGSMTEAVNNAIEEYKEEFDRYIDELLSSGVLGEEYIVRDDVDPYDEYGNRKPFSKTHYKYNIENVVKAMKSGRSKVGSSFTGGISYVKSIGAKKLNSIDEIKGNKNRIVPMTEEELEAENERISDLIKPLIQEVADSGSYNNDFITASNNIVDAFNSKNDVNGVYNYLKQYHDKIKMSTVKKLFAAKDEIENLPTRYFEAKPHRAVGFDEVKAAVIPADTHEALKGALKELGVPMYEYDSNSENNRAEVTQKAINTEYVDVNGEQHSDLRFAVDDTINDGMFADGDFFDEDGYIQQSIFERAVKDDPDFALSAVYNHAAKTAETAIKQSNDVKLDDKAYLLVARRLMARYDISRKLNKGFDEELAQTIRKHTERMEKGVADFAGELELLVDDCKDALMLSGWLDEEAMKSEREDILGYLRGKTLVIPEYAESDVKWEYDTIRRYRNKMFGKVNVALERNNPQGNIIYINDVIAFVEERYMSLITDEADEISGFKWLDNLVNNVLQPRFVNHYADGYGENIDTAAIEMAFDVTTEIINAKAKYAVADSKTERKYIRKIAIAKEQAAAEQRALLKAKVESYSDKAKEERSKRIKMIENLRRRMSEITDKSDKQRLKYEAQIDKLKSSLDAKTIILNMGYETIRDQYNENRTKTVYREKLGRMLDRMTKKLDGKANNNEYIPEVLKKPILDVLSSFTADPGTYKNGKKKALPGYYGEWKNIAKIGDRVNELTIAYESLKSKDNSKEKKYSFIDVNSIAFREGTLEVLKYLSENLSGKNIYDLSADDLIDIYEAMQELDNSLRSAVEIILDGQKMSVQEAANRAIAETESVKYKKDVQRFNNTAVNVAAGTFRTLKNKFLATQLDPKRFGRVLTGYHDDYVISQVMSELHEGDKKRTRIMQECFVKVQAVTSRYSKSEIKGLQRNDVTEFNFKEQKTGKRVKVSQGMLLAIYLTDRQADGHRHLVNENYNHYTVIPDLDMINLGRDGMNKSHKVRFSEADLRAIKQYVENNKILSELAGAISEVYNTKLNQYINEVSMAKYGKLIATVKNYYPLWVYSDGAHYEKNFEAEFNDIRMRSRSFTKQRTRSYDPIVINDVLKTFTKSVQSASEYCGLLIPIENFKRVYNSGNGDVTLHEAIKEKFGESAEHYIEKLMADLQNAPEILDNTWLQKAQGNFMGAKLLFNPGAAIKQLAAFPTAFNYFGVKNVTAAAAVGMAKIDFDLYAKYTPYLWYRKNGNGTVIGELSREMGFYRKWNERADIMGKMDRYVVGCLLYAAELHVEQTTDFKRGTDAFYKEVVRQFEKCVDETQPNNMITSKPQFIRNNIMKLLSLNAFKSQNMAIANSVIDSFGEFAARKAEYKESKTEEAKAAKNEAAKKFAGSVIGAVCSSALIGILTVAVNLFIWHKWDDFKDEEGNVTPLTILQNFGNYALESLAGCFVWSDKAYEAIKARIGLGKFFGFEVMSVETLNDAISNLTQGKFLEFAANIVDMFGFPMENLLRIARSISSYANDIWNGNGEIITENNSLRWENNTSYFNFIIVEAKQKGETEKAEHFEQMWKDDLIGRGKTEEQANDTIKTKLVTALAASDDDVEQAALAKANGDLSSYEEHMNKVVAYGFDSVDVKKAVDKVIKNIADDVKNRGLEEKSDIIADLKNQGFNDEGAEYVYKSIQSGESSESEDEFSAFADTSEGEGVAYTYADAFEYLKNGDRENYERIEQYLIDNNDKTKKDVQLAMRSASRTDKLWKEYFEAQGTLSGGGDPVKLEEYKKILTNIYGSWSTAVTYGRKYQKRMKEKEKKENK